MLIDADANSLDGKKPSAETVLHTSLYKRFPDIQSILHPHSLNATLISRLFKSEIVLEDYELLKALCGITTHESRVVVPIFANDQNIPVWRSLWNSIWITTPPVMPISLRARLYTWEVPCGNITSP